MRTLRSALSSLGRSPVKASVMLATVGLGVAALIFALSISTSFTRMIAERLEGAGLVVMVRLSSPPDGPGIPDHDVPKVIETLVHDVVDDATASRVDFVYPQSFAAGAATYEIRSVLTVSDEYLDIMALDVVAGSRFTAGSRDALLSASLAEMLFGSSLAALGQPLQMAVPRLEIRGHYPDSAALVREELAQVYTVRGVFADPDELRRRAYGIGDMLVGPQGTPSGRGTLTHFRLRFVMRVPAGRPATVESLARAAIAAQFGDEIDVKVWEGEPLHANGVLESIRSTVRTFRWW